MKRSEFVKSLIKSFGGEQEFADALHEKLTADSFSDHDGTWQLWSFILSMLQDDRYMTDILSSVGPGTATFVRPSDENAIAELGPSYRGATEAAVREFKASKHCAALGEAGPRVIDQFQAWLKETYLGEEVKAPA